MLDLNKPLFKDDTTRKDKSGGEREPDKSIDPLEFLKRPQAPKEYPWQNAARQRALPRVVTVACTITAKEFASLAEQAAKSEVSLSELGRERVLAPPPFEIWGDAAAKALDDMPDNIKQAKAVLAARRKQKRGLAALAMRKAEMKGTDAKEEYQGLLAANLTPKKERRIAKIQIRLTAYEAVKIRWAAYSMRMTLSSYMRKMILGYLPGGDDDQSLPWENRKGKTGKVGREDMLKTVIKVCAAGRIPPCTSLFYCKACAGVLSAKDKH